MIWDGVILGTMTTLGFCLIFGKLPPWVQEFMANHPVLTEIAISVGFYALMGMTLTAHVAVGAMILEVQGMLHIQRNPDKFLFLKAAKEKARESLKGLTDKLDTINEKYKNSLPEVKKINTI